MTPIEHFTAELRRFGKVATTSGPVLPGEIALRPIYRGGLAVLLNEGRLRKLGDATPLGEALKIRLALRPNEVAHTAKELGVRLEGVPRRENDDGMRSLVETSNWLLMSQYAELFGKIGTNASRDRRI